MASLAHTTRRSLFAITGGLAAAAAFPSAAMPDSGLAALAERWEKACAHEEALGVRLNQVCDRFLSGHPRPPRLPFTAADAERSGNSRVGGYWDWKEVERIARDAKEWRRESFRYPSREKWASRFERAVERCRAQVQAWDAECGYTAASEAWDAAVEETSAIERGIIASPCRSMADARIKARVAMKNADNDYGRDLAQQVAAFVLTQGLN